MTDPEKFCEVCGTRMERKRFNGRLEDRTRFLSRKTCSQSCGNTRPRVTRSAHQWRAKQHRKDACELCGTTTSLHVHHKDRDWRNDDPANLQTLCASCHLKLHWREDRAERMEANRRGVRTRQRSTAGSKSSDAPHPRQPNPAAMVAPS